MRVGFDAKRLFLNNRGLGNYSRTLMRGLHSYCPDIECVLYTPQVREPAYTEFADAGLEIQARSFPSALNHLLGPKAPNSGKLDIYHGLSAELPMQLPQSVGKIVTVHDLLFLRYPDYYSAIDRRIYAWKTRRCVEQADKIICISQTTQRDILEKYRIPESRTEVIYQAVHPRFQEEQTPSPPPISDPYFLYVGAVEERKNVSGLLKAFSILANTCDHHLVIVGSGRQSTELQSLAKQSSWASRVHFFDQIVGPNVVTFYRHASALVFPSFFEGFGLPLAEAMWTDLPIAAADNLSSREVCQDAALYFDAASPSDMAFAMRKVIEDSDLRSTLLARGREQRKPYDSQRATKQLRHAYESL